MIKVHADSNSLLTTAVTDFLELVESDSKNPNQISVVLTGGSLGIGFLAELSEREVDLSNVSFIFGDERFVDLDHADRNEHQGIAAFPDLLKFDLHRHPSPTESLEQGKKSLNGALEASYGPVQASGDVFDLVLLGVGPDGHVASLFPGHTQQGDWVIAEDASPKPPAQRLSLSYAALNRSKRVWFLAAGNAKAKVVGQALSGEGDLPLSKVHGSVETIWYLDKDLSDAL
ncbi:MAG: 6-phosphogluconolactonase [Aquiluna sp.]|nr:6-phosphogluconolactonase [Aquiluna sp.]